MAYVAYILHLRGKFVVGTDGYSMENKSCSLVGFLIVYAVIWVLDVAYIIRSHDQKSHIAPYFNHLDPGKAMVPFMILWKPVMPMPAPMIF